MRGFRPFPALALCRITGKGSMTDNTHINSEAFGDYNYHLLILINNHVSRVRLDLAHQFNYKTAAEILSDMKYISPHFLEFMFPSFDGVTISSHISHLCEVIE